MNLPPIPLTSWAFRNPEPGIVELYLIYRDPDQPNDSHKQNHLLLTLRHKQLWQSTSEGLQLLKNWPVLTKEEKEIQPPCDSEPTQSE